MWLYHCAEMFGVNIDAQVNDVSALQARINLHTTPTDVAVLCNTSLVIDEDRIGQVQGTPKTVESSASSGE
jgi:hypothetical protein